MFNIYGDIKLIRGYYNKEDYILRFWELAILGIRV